MTQKPPDPSRGAASTDSADVSARDPDPNDTTAPQGIPAVSRNVESAADAALASMVRSYSSRPAAGTEHERVTMPPPMPMELLVERMMLADSDRAPPNDIKPRISKTSGDSNPPSNPPKSDVDTVRTKMADMQRVPMSPAPASSPQDDVPTVPPYVHNADTLPPSNMADDTEPGFRPLMSEPPPPPSPTITAIGAAETILEQFGVEFFKGRPSSKEVPLDEPPPSRPAVEPPTSKGHEERWRHGADSRLTQARPIRPIPDVIPPSSSTGRTAPARRRPSETGLRPVDAPPPSSGRISSPAISTSDRLHDVRERYEAGDHRAALRMAEEILSEHPGHLAALGYAESSRQMLRQKYLSRIGDMNVVPRIKHVAVELARVGVDSRDMHIVDAIDGVHTVEEIVGVSGMSTLDVLRVLNDLVIDGLVEFVGTATGRR